jgi:hypothetical protein
MNDINSPLWRALERFYTQPDPPPRQRDPSKPMQVICVGFPRSGTESLQHALLKLGYDHTYHGWDILYEQPNNCQRWARLARRKFVDSAATGGDIVITAAEFDEVVGHAVALVDAPASVFAAELIEAYPDAKIILNQRKDLDAWHRSCVKNLGEGVYDQWHIWFIAWWGKSFFWLWHIYERYLWLHFFEGTTVGLTEGVKRNGKRLYKAHANQIRGIMHSRGESDRLLEWYLEDGWEPLCKFLGKPVPDEPFPRTNDAAGFKGHVDELMKIWVSAALWNMAKVGAGLALGVGLVVWKVRSG